jgi:hypothetical protein
VRQPVVLGLLVEGRPDLAPDATTWRPYTELISRGTQRRTQRVLLLHFDDRLRQVLVARIQRRQTGHIEDELAWMRHRDGD